jgi:hypothetical protein
MEPRTRKRAITLIVAMVVITAASTRLKADTGTCQGQMLTLPFTDVPGTNVFFCSIAQAFFTGLTVGTTPTTYSPGSDVTREQMAAFITRTQDSALRRGSRRAATGEWWTPRDVGVLRSTDFGFDVNPQFNCFDGEDIWVANNSGNSVTRVHASDGRVLGTWTGASFALNTIAAAGFIYVTGVQNPGQLYRIDPRAAPGPVTLVENNLGAFPRSITFDGLNLWTANRGTGPGQGSITRYNIVADTETTFVVGFNQPAGIVFDGTHLWVVDEEADELYRVNPANGTVLENLDLVVIESPTAIPVFDGANIWVPVKNHLTVVSTSTPARVLAMLPGNGLGEFNTAVAFDGERIMVTVAGPTPAVSLWKATSLTPLGTLALGGSNVPRGVCSDGLHFWIVIDPSLAVDFLLRF